MTAQPQISNSDDIARMMEELGRGARKAANELSLAPTETKNKALRKAANALRARKDEIMSANAKDMTAASGKGISAALLDRLELNEARIESMAAGLEAIADLRDPVG